MGSPSENKISEPAANEGRRNRNRKNTLFALLLFLPALLIGVFAWGSGQGWFGNLGFGADDKDTASTTIPPALPVPLPPSDPETDKEMSADEAIEINAAIPDSDEPVVPARPFTLPNEAIAQMSRSTALNCLTSAIYYEAATESEKGQRAVAQVVLNRVRHPAYPKSVCGVVFQGSERSTGCQFTFTCDGSLSRKPNQRIWDRAKQIATAAYAGAVEPSVGSSTHYHTVWIVPYWAKSLTKVRTIGSHIFYRWPGYWGKRAAFTDVYAGEDLTEALAEGSGDDLATDIPGEAETGEDVVEVVEIPPLIPDSQKSPLPGAAVIAADRSSAPLAADRNSGTLIID